MSFASSFIIYVLHLYCCKTRLKLNLKIPCAVILTIESYFYPMILILILFFNSGDDCPDPADTAAGPHQEEARGAEGELQEEARRGKTGKYRIIL